MSTAVVLNCDCGFTATYSSKAKADYFGRRHNCATWTARQEASRRAAERRNTPGPTRECQHKRANHQHGTYAAYVLDNCRCLPCKQANRNYENNRKKQQAYGRWNGLIDAQPARDHIAKLRAAGVGLRRISLMSGVSTGTLTKLVYGIGNRPPSRRIRPATAQAILVIPMPTVDVLGATVPVDGTGTRRRLQALVAIGWSISKLARELDISNLHRVLRDVDHQVAARTARAVRDLYEQLWDQAPPEDTQRDRIAASRARRFAALQGWVPPLAWDDDAIDNPDAVPAVTVLPVEHDDDIEDLDEVVIYRLMTGDKVDATKAERAEAIRRLADEGLSDAQIADRLHVSSKTVLRIRTEHQIPSRWAAA